MVVSWSRGPRLSWPSPGERSRPGLLDMWVRTIVAGRVGSGPGQPREGAMSVEDPHGPLILCFDGSEAAERAIRIAPGLVGRGREARVLYAYKPTERSLGVAQALTGGRIDAPVLGEADAHD